MKTNRIITVAVLTAIVLTGYINASDEANCVPGELIVKLEHGVLDPFSNEETAIGDVSIQHPQLELFFQQYDVRSVERVFKRYIHST